MKSILDLTKKTGHHPELKSKLENVTNINKALRKQLNETSIELREERSTKAAIK